MKLDIGCGRNKKKGYFGIDISDHPEVDSVCNIDIEQLPIADGVVGEIYSAHTLEHCRNIVHIMNEFWRVCKHGASIYIIVPYGVGYQFIQDPTHVTPFNESTFRKYFCDENYVAAFGDYGIKGKFAEEEILIKGKDILHLQLHVKIKVIKHGTN